MIHLAGASSVEKLNRALDELEIYEGAGVDGAIIEDYHGERKDLLTVLEVVSRRRNQLVIGVNQLRDPIEALFLAAEYGAQFVQFDSVQAQDLNVKAYEQARHETDIPVFGGIRFKYQRMTGKPLEEDLRDGMSRCEAIVTIGEGTGVETPLEKLIDFKNAMGNFPLIVGAGVTPVNVKSQLHYADGVIVGSYFKPYGNTNLRVYEDKVNQLMREIRSVRVA